MPLTKEEISSVKIEPQEEGVFLPVIPNWTLHVNGRKFGEYMAIARENPRRSILFLPIADPCSQFANIWGTIATFNDFSYTAFVVPLSLAFNDYTDANAYWYLDFIGSAIYILDLIFEFHIGFIVRWDASSVTITDGIQVAKNYMRNGSLWIDLLSCLPVIAQVIMIALTGNKMNSAAARSILLIKLLRLGRVIRLITRMNRLDTGGILHQWIAARVKSITMFIGNTFFSLMVLVNLLACMWWWIAETQGLENSWVAAVAINKPDIDLINGSDATRWLVCAYYSLVTMATIGYGDIVPVTTAEIGLVILFIFCGVAYFGFILSTVSALLESRSTDGTVSGGDWTKFQEMEIWMRRFSFPHSLQRNIRRHCYAASISSLALEEDEFQGFYKLLPLWLKYKVAIELQRSGLKALVGGEEVWDSLSEITQNAVSRVVAVSSEPKLMSSNNKLYSIGDSSDSIYFVEEGQLAFFLPGVAQVVTISSPAVVGTGSLFASWSEASSIWKATARTATRCFLWKINATKLQQELMNIAPEVLNLILEHYIDELKHTRAGLDKLGRSPLGVASLKQSYDDRIKGALRAADDLKAKIQTIKEEEAAAEAARRERIRVAEKASLQKVEGLQKAGMVEARVAEENSVAAQAAVRVPELELQNPDAVATAIEYEVDLEHNSSTISQVIEGRLDRRQATMHLEEEASKDAAVGILRKKGITTFVV